MIYFVTCTQYTLHVIGIERIIFKLKRIFFVSDTPDYEVVTVSNVGRNERVKVRIFFMHSIKDTCCNAAVINELESFLFLILLNENDCLVTFMIKSRHRLSAGFV